MKRLFVWGALIAGTLLVALVAAGWTLYANARTSNVGDVQFENVLRIPPLLAPREQGGRKIFELALQQDRGELLPGKPAETWGVNGAYLGPTLRAERGDRVEIRVRNELPQATTLHWHGMRLPAAADGGPHQSIAPGASWSPSWTIDQPAATLWYHPHPHGKTADQVYRGLAGLFILDDAESAELALPADYGSDDIPLIIQDKRLNDDGSLDFSQSWVSPTGRLGEAILVNGTHGPYLEIADQRVRFRLVNASNARIYDIGFADERTFQLIATDGGLLERPQRLERVLLSPGERAEIVAAFAPGEEVMLRSFEPDLGANFFVDRFSGGDDRFDLLQIRASTTLAPSPEVPARLAVHDPLDAEDAVRVRRFELGNTSINGNELDLGRFDAVVERGATETWEVQNASATPHNFHPHGLTFMVVRYAGGPPPAQLSGPKDTVYVPPGETVRLIVRAPEHADPDRPYMFHCHILQHEDRGMMGQFVVVEPGQPGDPTSAATRPRSRPVSATMPDATSVTVHYLPARSPLPRRSTSLISD